MSEASPPPIRVAVDGMGGDFPPVPNIEGTLAALAVSPRLSVVLYGDETTLKAELDKRGHAKHDRISIVHCEEVITMEDHAVQAIRSKKRSSLTVGLTALKNGEVDAFLSAGNSGAVMAGAIFIVGRLNDIERPAIMVKMPTAEGHVIILDAGANVDCRPQHLVQFAELAHAYCELIEKKPRPRIALLSNGSESHKGTELTRETHKLLSTLPGINYRGYLEGNEVFKDKADVIVCDGFVGNVLLKLAEGLAETSFQWFRAEVRKSWGSLLGVTFLKKILHKFKSKFDYQPYGAAPLLGIDGLVFISHGASTAEAIKNGILGASHAVSSQFVEKLKTELAQIRKAAT